MFIYRLLRFSADDFFFDSPLVEVTGGATTVADFTGPVAVAGVIGSVVPVAGFICSVVPVAGFIDPVTLVGFICSAVGLFGPAMGAVALGESFTAVNCIVFVAPLVGVVADTTGASVTTAIGLVVTGLLAIGGVATWEADGAGTILGGSGFVVTTTFASLLVVFCGVGATTVPLTLAVDACGRVVAVVVVRSRCTPAAIGVGTIIDGTGLGCSIGLPTTSTGLPICSIGTICTVGINCTVGIGIICSVGTKLCSTGTLGPAGTKLRSIGTFGSVGTMRGSIGIFGSFDLAAV